MKLSVAIVLLACVLPVAARTAQPTEQDRATEARTFCVKLKSDQPDTQIEMNVCSFADFLDADLQLNGLYALQMSRLTEPEKSRLRDSQRAWISFRDKACLYEARAREESGTIWALDQNSCLIAHTKQRIQDLKAYVACTQNGCPD